MRTLIARAALLSGSIFLVSCATSTKPLPKFEKPLVRAAVMNVRTTAYTHSEADHVQYSNHTALGGTLQSGRINSAAADWSRWPAGSIFRIRETGEIFQVDDYGWALAGTNTIDLYKSSRAGMNQWGVRRVTIENLRWGDPKQSLSILRPRSRYRHIKRMVDQLEERMPEYEAAMRMAGTNSAPSPGAEFAPTPAASPAPMLAAAAPPVPVAVAVAVPISRAVPPAQPVSQATLVPFSPAPMRTAQATRSTATTATKEAFLNSIR